MSDAIDVDAFANWLSLRTCAARTSLRTHLSEWKSDPIALTALRERARRFQAAYAADPNLFTEVSAHFEELSRLEEDMAFSNTTGALENESYNELLFLRPALRPLNFLSWLLSLWAAFRIYLLPGLSILLPLLTLIAPYVILTYVFNMPITLDKYAALLQSLFTGNVQRAMNPASLSSEPVFSAGNLKQLGILAVTFAQSILQPYWTYQHLSKVDSIICERGRIVLRFHAVYEEIEALLKRHGIVFYHSPLPVMRTEREAAAHALLNPTYFQIAWKYLGALEVIMRLTHAEGIHPVKWVSSSKPMFRAQHTFDFHVPQTQRKPCTVNLERNRCHALLTGPNKGGKSTVLRALSATALLAHTYGCSFGYLVATPFARQYVCLKPDDLPGTASRFEREMEFTAATLTEQHTAATLTEHDAATESGRILVFIDELYHSTNPPDALRSCEIYGARLWARKDAVSVISTHLFEWVERAPEAIKRFCCPAAIHGEHIEFSYQLEKGVCKVSSVDMLLRKSGLLEKGPNRAQSHRLA